MSHKRPLSPPSAEHLRRMLEASAEGNVSIDRRGNLTFVNRAAADMLGYVPDDLLGRNFHALVHDRHLDGSPYAERQCPIHLSLASGRGCRVDNEVFWRRDGSAFWVEYLATPFGERGTVDGAVVTFRDVTEPRRLEDRFRHAQMMEPVSRLASDVTHDFNNLLTIISGYSEILLARLALDDPHREMVAAIKQAEERASELTRQLLALSRKRGIEPTVLDLNAVIAGMSKLFVRLIGADVELLVLPDAGLGAVRADVAQWEQVLLNLAINARDAMPEGGRLVFQTANVELDDAYARAHPEAAPGSYVQLTVTDTGCGMTDEVRAHLFEPFYTTKEPGKGTGLGLSIVHGIVKQSGGHVVVDSAPERGTTFHIYLPRVRAAAQPDKPNPRAAPPERGTETILLVEDDPELSELMALVLATLGYTVLRAYNGNEALRIAAEYPEPIHLVVCDVDTPPIAGGELVQRLSALRPGLRVLWIAGDTAGIPLDHGVAETEAAVLAKPFTTEALASNVREVLDRVVVGR